MVLARSSRINGLNRLSSSPLLRRDFRSISCFSLPTNTGASTRRIAFRIDLNSKLTRPGLASLSSIHCRWKSSAVSKKTEQPKSFGDEPPLFDGKPRFWARWLYALLLLDVLFTYVPILPSSFLMYVGS